MLKPEGSKNKMSSNSKSISQTFGNDVDSTAEFLLCMDKIFDSVNGSSINVNHEKQCDVIKTSNRKNFWVETVKVTRIFNEEK